MNGANLALSRLQKREMAWGDLYIGTVEDLILAGIVQATQVPGLPGIPKRQATFCGDGSLVRTTRGEAWLQIRLIRNGWAEVRVSVSEDTKSERHAAAMAEKQRSEEAARARARIADMPDSHDAYRAGTARFAATLLKSIQWHAAADPTHGFQYDDDEREELQRLCSEILDLLKTGTTVFDRRLHQTEIMGHQALIARSDSGFVSMLENLTQTAKGGHHA